MTAAPELTVLLPAIDEGANLRLLLPELRKVLDEVKVSHEIIVVDGGSTDDGPAIAREAGARVVAQTGRGYGAAIRTGFAEARGSRILCLDADNSHRPDYIPAMLEASHEADLVIASRYVEGGHAEMGPLRRLLSAILNGWYRLGLDLPYRDLSSGFRCYRREAVEPLRVEADGYQFLPEILLRMHCQGLRIAEVPFRYSPRIAGSSHVKLLRFGWAYFTCFLRLWGVRRRSTSTSRS